MNIPQAANNLQGIGNLTGAAQDALGRLAGGSFRSQLLPATYRGFRFYVLSGSARFGRRNALHEYPKRDLPWVEDMGRSARHFNVVGYIVGDDVIAQRDRLIALVEKEGDGDLMHPTLGKRLVALMDFSVNEQWDQGRRFEVTFDFIEQGRRTFPTTAANATQEVSARAAAADKSAAQAFVTRTLSALQQGVASAAAASERVSVYAERARQVTTDATSIYKLAVGLPGEFGRMLGIADGLGRSVIKTPGATLASLSALAVAARTSVTAALSRLADSASSLSAQTVSELTDAVQAVVASVLAAAPAPGEAVRNLLTLSGTANAPPVAGPVLAVQAATQDVMRRAALTAAAAAAASYVPASADDAVVLRTRVLGALDAEVTRAGDQGEDAVYADMRQLRTRTAAALNAAGALAPELRDVETNLPLPALVLAQRLYRDSSRSDDLVARAAPAHPAFMPTRFRAPST